MISGAQSASISLHCQLNSHVQVCVITIGVSEKRCLRIQNVLCWKSKQNLNKAVSLNATVTRSEMQSGMGKKFSQIVSKCYHEVGPHVNRTKRSPEGPVSVRLEHPSIPR